jgi:hypothetical protein
MPVVPRLSPPPLPSRLPPQLSVQDSGHDPSPTRPVLARWIAIAVAFCLQHSAWLVSVGLHGLAAAGLAVLVWHQQPAGQQVDLSAVIGSPEAPQSFETMLDHPLLDAIPDAGRESLSTSTPLPGVPRSFGSLASDLPSGTASTGIGAGGGDGDGIKIGVSFFSSSAEGNSFVFVVDMSGSMSSPSRGGSTRFHRAMLELTKSISKLKARQKFYIIFFNTETQPLFYPKPARELVPATTSMKNRARRWIRSRQPQSGTDPNEAFDLALRLEPDAIFFLTDGELPDPEGTRRAVQLFNRKKVAIHTIGFETFDGDDTLQQLAKENGGTYRHVK